MVAQEHEQESESIRQLRRRNHPAALAPVPVPVTLRALNRLEWPMQHRVVLAGVRVLVRSTSERDWDRVLACLPKGRPFAPDLHQQLTYSLTPAGAPHLLEPSNQYVLYRIRTRVIRDRAIEPVLKELLGDLASVLAHINRRWTFFHSGAVSLHDAGIILPGRSGYGKTTLVQTLLEAGARYYSDEVAVVDPRGGLHPFIKPLAVQMAGDWSAPKLLVDPGSLGVKNGHRVRPVRLVAFPERRHGARLKVTRLPRSTAALALFSNAFAAQARPERTLTDATTAVANALCVHIRYAEAERALPVLRELLDESLAT